MEASPTAETDSVNTDATGYYEIDLVGGIYDVHYQHEGFYEESLTDQNFFSPQTLPDVTLLISPNAEISGAISGVLTSGYYLVTGNLSIVNGETLTIEPGTELRFDGMYYFTVGSNQILICQGTESDSIKFLPNYYSGVIEWGGFGFIDSAENDVLEYCLVTETHGSDGAAIYCSSSSPIISHCTITENSADDNGGGIACISTSSPTISYCIINGNSAEGRGGGIYCGNSSSPTISYCTINGNTAGSDGGGIYCNSSNPTISDCTISENSSNNGGGGGIFCISSSPSISNCMISGNSAYSYGGGLYCSTSSSPTVEHSTINGNSANSKGGGITCYNLSNPIISRCTVSGNTASDMGGGIYCSSSSSPTIINSTVTNNNDEGIYAIDANSYPELSFCGFHNNSDGDFVGLGINPFLGVIVTVNANGDSCDAYLNIFLDPLYVDPDNGNFHLQETSPCIDAGDPDSPLDPDGTVADIGAFYFDQNYTPVISITYPAGGEVWEPGQSYTILWDDNIQENVAIELFQNMQFAEVISSNTESDGSYSWLIPVEGISGDNFRVLIYSVEDPAIFAGSEVFSIEHYTPPLIELTLSATDPLIVPRGSFFEYSATITSNLPEPEHIDIWTLALTPGATLIGPIWRINDFPILPGGTISADGIWQEVPVNAPLGVYTFGMRVGDYPDVVVAEDSFTFEVIPAVAASANAISWTGGGYETLVELAESGIAYGVDLLPKEYLVAAAYPNPFNPSTTISVSLPQAADLTVSVYNVNGQLVAELVDASLVEGTHQFTFDASNLASGLYFVRATVPGQMNQVQKVMLMR